MGTVFSFVFGAPIESAVLRAVERELDRIDRVFSTYRPDSDISVLARDGRARQRWSVDLAEVFRLCGEAAELTSGYFDPFHVGHFDPTGLVKGWAVARVARLLEDAGSSRHAINGGGDVLVVADPRRDDEWRIGVSDGTPGGIVATLSTHNAAVATSGNTERPGEIIDPFTGRPALALETVTVIGSDIVMADAVATAAVAMGAAALQWLDALPGYEAVVVSADGTVAATRGLPASVTSTGRVQPAPR